MWKQMVCGAMLLGLSHVAWASLDSDLSNKWDGYEPHWGRLESRYETTVSRPADDRSLVYRGSEQRAENFQGNQGLVQSSSSPVVPPAYRWGQKQQPLKKAEITARDQYDADKRCLGPDKPRAAEADAVTMVQGPRRSWFSRLWGGQKQTENADNVAAQKQAYREESSFSRMQDQEVLYSADAELGPPSAKITPQWEHKTQNRRKPLWS